MNVVLIGYGEVGRILAEDLRKSDQRVVAYDLELGSGAAAEPMRKHARSHGVILAESHADAVRRAELVVSAVTADQTVAAARACATALPPQTFFLDLNSASPGAKIDAAESVASGSGRYVEAAVMTSVPPHRIRVPMLLGGPHARELLPALERLGFAATVASDAFGVVSATKMCRSVIVKGLEAMIIESFTSARHYGVENAVIASLRETFPGIDWEKQAAYFFQRVIEHGRRRSEEMREAAVTVREAGLEPWSATATAERQAWVADLVDAGLFGAESRDGSARTSDWRPRADRVLSRSARTRKE
jgi:3-hydroxyisobutyrate dehydrogenase-like beta-hydroxyacid dehydrogenase